MARMLTLLGLIVTESLKGERSCQATSNRSGRGIRKGVDGDRRPWCAQRGVSRRNRASYRGEVNGERWTNVILFKAFSEQS